MKKLTYSLLSLVLIGVSGSTMAAKDPVDIMHCGCIYVATDETTGTATMEWQALTISSRGKGHRNHVVDSTDDCLSGFENTGTVEEPVYEPLYTLFVRDYDDCVMSGNFPHLDDCDEEEPPVEGDLCGAELVE